MGRLLRGTHGGAPEVASAGARAGSACASTRRPPTRPTASGTARASAELAIEAVPGALRVLVPREA